VAQGCEWLEAVPVPTGSDGGVERDGGSGDTGAGDGPDGSADEGTDGGTMGGGEGGVPDGSPMALVCVGHAPLTLTFVPITSGDVDSYVWSFGETGQPPVREKTPTHTFVLPGTYQVALTVGGPGGTLTVRPEPPFVRVLSLGLGEVCDTDGQCEEGLRCRCPAPEADGTCGAAMGGRGICTAHCTNDGECGAQGMCADMGVSASWRSPLCVAACDEDAACPKGLLCRSLPSRDQPGMFVQGCFPRVLGDVGEPCLGFDGEPRPDVCMGGLCLSLGVGGYCSAPCGRDTCPRGSACVRLSGGEADTVCLAACGPSPCDHDPGLACEREDLRGALGFEVVDAASPEATYCAPKRCHDEEACDGLRCVAMGEASFCVPGE